MKPLKLVINAFGPYVDKTTIDFENFGDNGLYLITGDTGAGKTTIFDAMSYALFGEASGSARSKVHTYRSDFAKDDNATFVEMEFLRHGEKYFIRRESSYLKDGRKTAIPERATLTKPDKTTLSGTSEVNSEIQNIIGIDKDQFSKIVMIAQGEFQKFLLAPTKERLEIFRKIFGTEKYEEFLNELKNRLNSTGSDKNDKKLLLENSITNIISDNDDELEQLKNNENIVYNLGELLEKLEISIKNDEKENKSFDEKSKKIQKEFDDLTKDIEKATGINNDKKSLKELKEKLPEYEQKAKDTAKIYNTEKAKDKDRKNLEVSIANLEKSIPEYGELEKIQKEQNDKNTVLETLKETLEVKQKELDELKKQNKSDNTELEKLKDLSGEIIKNESDIKTNKDKKDELKSYQAQISVYRKAKDDYDVQSEIVKQAHGDYEEKEKIAKNIYNQFMANQAGILAKDLKDGLKCPVCGSEKHPHPAKLINSDVSENDLNDANKAQKEAQKKSTDEATKLGEMQGNIKNLEGTLMKYAKTEFGLKVIEGLEQKIEDSLTENQKQYDNLQKEKKDLEEKQNRKKELEEATGNFEKNKDALDKEIAKIQQNQTDIKTAIASLKSAIKEKQKNLQYKTKDEAQKTLNKAQDDLNLLKQALQDTEDAKNKASNELSEVKGRIDVLEKKIPKDFDVDIEKLNSQKTEKQDELSTLTESNKGLYNRFKTNKTLLNDIKKLQKEFENLSEEYEILDNLHRTANGTLKGGKHKISFEGYVLGVYFDEIINAANERFKEMTSYQFELRKAEAKSGNAQTGLDLNVFDYYTGKERSVSTLSGGESFKAALALSLGMSDIVQQRAGGVEIETMFIDEGFGSLDPESLDQTMKTLSDLSGNKTLIGIISHVADLREKIDNKIVVTKTQSGSKLDIYVI